MYCHTTVIMLRCTHILSPLWRARWRQRQQRQRNEKEKSTLLLVSGFHTLTRHFYLLHVALWHFLCQHTYTWMYRETATSVKTNPSLSHDGDGMYSPHYKYPTTLIFTFNSAAHHMCIHNTRVRMRSTQTAVHSFTMERMVVVMVFGMVFVTILNR